MDLNKEIQILKNSPLFNISLGSKELFHSNFLYWLANKYPYETGQLFSKYLNNNSGDVSILDSEREKENIDLYLEFKNGQKLFIENKVKSIPYKEQLEQYTKEQNSKNNFQNNNFLLLSLTQPSFDLLNINGVKWHCINYYELGKLLNNLIPKIKTDYEKNIVKDYIGFILALQNVESVAKINFSEDKFDFNNGQIYKQFKEIRLADLYLKKKYELIAQELYNRLGKEFKSLVVFEKWSKERAGKLKPGFMFVNSGMTRAQGLVEVMYTIKKDLCMGVQIQDNSYRKFVFGKNGKKIAKNLKDQNKWFDFSQIKHLEEYPNQSGKEFNKYGEDYLYRSVKISEEILIKEVINYVIKDIKSAFKLIEYINKI